MKPFEVMKPERLYNFKFDNIFEIYLLMASEKEANYAQAENDIKAIIESIENELQ